MPWGSSLLACSMTPAGQKRKTAFAQAVTSWNDWLTYKGLSLHVSGRQRRSRTKIHQGSECHWLTRWATVRWEQLTWAPVCPRNFQLEGWAWKCHVRWINWCEAQEKILAVCFWWKWKFFCWDLARNWIWINCHSESYVFTLLLGTYYTFESIFLIPIQIVECTRGGWRETSLFWNFKVRRWHWIKVHTIKQNTHLTPPSRSNQQSLTNVHIMTC